MTYRIFMSYAVSDTGSAKQIKSALESLGHQVVWDEGIPPGYSFLREIQEMLSDAHLIMPVVTPNSINRPWVHEELGYALALNLPVVPLAVGASLLREMTAQVQVLSVSPDLSDLDDQLSTVDFDSLVRQAGLSPSRMRVEIARHPEERTQLLAKCARRLQNRGYSGHVRKKSGLSCFAIPDRRPRSQIWIAYEGTQPRTTHMRRALREERRAMEYHARCSGCSLMLYLGTTQNVEQRGGDSALVPRLRVLREFLDSMPDTETRVVFLPEVPLGTTTMIGDWFLAEAIAYNRDGFQQTIVTRHAPTVAWRVKDFDLEFEELAERQSFDRRNAIERIDCRLAELACATS